MTATLLSLAGLFVALYLYLYKIGRIGTLACGSGACETVQASRYSRFLGIEVALIGVFGYATLLLVSLVALQPQWVHDRRPALLLAALSGGAVLFTVYLKALELFVIHAICRWCVVSAILIVAFHFVTLLDLRRLRHVSA